MRIRKKSWEENVLTTNEHLVHNPEDYKGKWNEYFGNNNPIYVEIGCGNFHFLKPKIQRLRLFFPSYYILISLF